MNSEEQFIEEGLIYCSNCNRSEKITLEDIYMAVDRSVDPCGDTPNVYPVSVLKCHYCGKTFEAIRVDPRPLKQITEISFGEFTVYTTLPLEKAVKKAVKWYTDRFDYPLGEPVIQSVGTDIYTTDPYDIVIPQGDE